MRKPNKRTPRCPATPKGVRRDLRGWLGRPIDMAVARLLSRSLRNAHKAPVG